MHTVEPPMKATPDMRTPLYKRQRFVPQWWGFHRMVLAEALLFVVKRTPKYP